MWWWGVFLFKLFRSIGLDWGGKGGQYCGHTFYTHKSFGFPTQSRFGLSAPILLVCYYYVPLPPQWTPPLCHSVLTLPPQLTPPTPPPPNSCYVCIGGYYNQALQESFGEECILARMAQY